MEDTQNAPTQDQKSIQLYVNPQVEFLYYPKDGSEEIRRSPGEITIVYTAPRAPGNPNQPYLFPPHQGADEVEKIPDTLDAKSKDIKPAKVSLLTDAHKVEFEIEEGNVTKKGEISLQKEWPALKNTAKSGSNLRGYVVFVDKDNRQVDVRGDVVKIPPQWVNTLLPMYGQRRHHVALTQYDPQVFRQLRKTDAGRLLMKEVMEHLTSQKVLIRTFAPGNNWTETTENRKKFLRQFGTDGDCVTAAAALALAVRVETSDRLFAFLVGSSPAPVITELATIQRGGLMSADTARTALKYIGLALVSTSPRPKRMLADSAANMVTACFREKDSKDWPALKAGLSNLIGALKSDMLDTQNTLMTKAKNSGILTAIVFAGLLKRIGELEKDSADDYEKAKLAIDVTLTLVGVAGHGLGTAMGITTVLADALLEHFWVNKSAGLRDAMRDLITDAIYWPLVDRRELPFSHLAPGEAITSSASGPIRLNKVELDEFKSYFELVMRSNNCT
ncbi:hypothetical protein FOYG_17075 [Fusarium oxysporum NRRL 32931]|uniref:Uncharacterized protein n=1 Tax=Fusarium oxysporum NRRL 32931 TaxID=660029 RepID=W9HFL9_FUSOX|nr:hypothetical protein FOYG_17075 [Fusarium oxysporum NRRL 32931]